MSVLNVPFPQSGSLSRLFVSFLESESAPPSSHHSAPLLPHSHLSPPPTGRVDPATDLDRPSRATAANLAYPPLSLRSTSLPPSSQSVPSTLPPSSHASTVPISSSSSISASKDTSGSTPIHSHIDTLSLPDTETTRHSYTNTSTTPHSYTSTSTTPHSYTNTSTTPHSYTSTSTTRHSYTGTSTTPHSYTSTAIPQSTHSGLDTTAVGTLAALTLPAGSFPSPVPPSTPNTSRTTAASTSGTGGPRTAHTSLPLLHAVPDARGSTPAWSKNHSYQSSILKNLLSTDQ